MFISGLGTGVVASTGIGDGHYPVVAHYKNIGSKGIPDYRVSAISIDFL